MNVLGSYNFKKIIYEVIEIVIGTLIIAFGIACFLLPNQLSSGGFSGIATILYYLLKTPMGTTILILNVPLYIMAIWKIGKELFIKALFGTIMLSVFIDLFESITPITQDRFLACIYGGIASGLGTAIVLKTNASTGGTDLLSYIIRSYNPSYKSSSLIVITDTIIIGFNILFFKDIEIGLYSAIAIFLMGKMIDIVFEGVYFTKMIYIISPKYQDIAEKIGRDIRRGTTRLVCKRDV